MCKILSEKLKKLSTEVIPSNTTKSEYYVIGCIKVRVSDHMSVNSDSDLDVFYNGKSTFVVIPMIGIFKQVQWFTSANDVIDFIVKFEEIAKLLVKRHDILDAIEYQAAVNPEIPSDYDCITDYEKWRSVFQVLYRIKDGALKMQMDALFSNNTPEIEVKLRHTGGLNASQKVIFVNKLVGTLSPNAKNFVPRV